MQCMAHYIPVLDFRCRRRYRLAIDLDLARLYGIFLKLSVRFLLHLLVRVRHT